MSDARSAHLDAAAAAAERTRSTRRRLIELQQRMERLRAGEPPTREDVARAQAAVEAQRRAFAQAQRRMVAARSTWRRHSGPLWSALSAPGTGEDDPYGRLREAFVSLASSRLGDSEVPSERERRRQLATALVEKAAEQAGSWTEALCRLAVAVLPGTAGSGVSTYDDDGVAHPVAAADDRSAELEEAQEVVGEGPGCAANVEGRPVLVEDLAQLGQRWPGYVATVRDLGIAAVWSLPVTVDGGVLGSLTLYHEADRVTTPDGWADALTLAELAASTMIIDADLVADHRPTIDNPPDLVDVASGMLAVRAGLQVDQAFALLRGYAFSTGRRISEVAADVVTGSIDLG